MARKITVGFLPRNCKINSWTNNYFFSNVISKMEYKVSSHNYRCSLVDTGGKEQLFGGIRYFDKLWPDILLLKGINVNL